jgi:glycosyltransferase involved in cell wall biosynthesis
MRDNGVKFVGHVFPVLSELLLASAVVVPTSVPLGNRVRILTCWDLRIPVVAHQANQAGIPELLNGYNALLSRSGKEMAEQILHLIGSAELSDELRVGGEWSLQRNFSVETIANDLTSILRTFQS